MNIRKLWILLIFLPNVINAMDYEKEHGCWLASEYRGTSLVEEPIYLGSDAIIPGSVKAIEDKYGALESYEGLLRYGGKLRASKYSTLIYHAEYTLTDWHEHKIDLGILGYSEYAFNLLKKYFECDFRYTIFG